MNERTVVISKVSESRMVFQFASNPSMPGCLISQDAFQLPGPAFFDAEANLRVL
jgi:3-hydroxymyristoyl/3-hydroxydecanoyl-(acyl carrier protein) dehydratase